MKTHFGFIPKYFYGDKSTSSVTVTLDDTKNNIEKVETEVKTINSEIPGTEVTVTETEEKPLEPINTSNKISENLQKKIMDMKNHVHHSSEVSLSVSDDDDNDNDDDDDADDDDDDDADEEINIKADNVEVDKTFFEQVLQSSMKLQVSISEIILNLKLFIILFLFDNFYRSFKYPIYVYIFIVSKQITVGYFGNGQCIKYLLNLRKFLDFLGI